MGSGSSRSGRPAGPGGASSEGGTGPLVSASPAAREEAPRAAAAGAAEGAAGPDGRDETLRLLDQLLAESAAWGAEDLAPRGPARPRPAARAGSPVSPKQSAEGHPESSSFSETPGSSHKTPVRQSAVSYDYSEEELMASIEQEYCR